VNGQVLEEPYIAAAPIYNGEWNVPEDKLFVWATTGTIRLIRTPGAAAWTM
jgi:hypothetical protein